MPVPQPNSATDSVETALAKNILLIAHAPSANVTSLVEAVLQGARSNEVEGVSITYLCAQETQPEDIINADAVIIGTTENLGYMSGLIKDVFDRCYYPCLDLTQGKPFTFFVRAGHDGTGTKRAIETITRGLKWRLIQDPLICRGEFSPIFVDQCEALGLLVAASLEAGII